MKTKAHYARTAAKLKRYKQWVKEKVKQDLAEKHKIEKLNGGPIGPVSPVMFLALPF